MNTIYKGHLPGSLGLLEVRLGSAERLKVTYQGPNDDEPKTLPSVQAAVDRDLEDDDVIDRLNYASHLNGILVSKIKAARKEAEPKSKRVKVDPCPTGADQALGTTPITAENVDQLPDNLRPETRERIFAGLGIEDPKRQETNE